MDVATALPRHSRREELMDERDRMEQVNHEGCDDLRF